MYIWGDIIHITIKLHVVHYDRLIKVSLELNTNTDSNLLKYVNNV